MKKLFVVWALMSAGLVYANCSNHNYCSNGRCVMCTTCCDSNGRNCTTFCA